MQTTKRLIKICKIFSQNRISCLKLSSCLYAGIFYKMIHILTRWSATTIIVPIL